MKKLSLLWLVGVLSLVPAAQAQWQTITYTLRGGWNAIYLQGDATHTTIDNLFAGTTSVISVWRWNPNPNPAQFKASSIIPTASTPEWSVWVKGDAAQTTLTSLSGQMAYLVKCSGLAADTYTVAITQRILPPKSTWVRNGANFLGFPALAGTSAPTLSAYFATFPAAIASNARVYKYVGGELGPGNPVQIYSPSTEKIDPNQAYWFEAAVVGDFYAPVEITPSASDGLSFGRTGSFMTVRVRNRTSAAVTVTIAPVDSVAEPAAPSSSPTPGTTAGNLTALAPVPMIRRTFNAATATNTDTAITGAYTEVIPALSEVQLTVGVDRSKMAAVSGTAYASFLRFTDSGSLMNIVLPCSARVANLAGLWVGDVQVSTVTTLAPGATGSTTPRSFPLRVIFHVDNTGVARLLSEVYVGKLAGSADSVGLGTRESALQADQKQFATRLSAGHLPLNFIGPSANGSFALGQYLDVVVPLSFNDPTNPFVHTYHPDHDNRDALLVPSGAGQESYTVVRTLRFAFSGQTGSSGRGLAQLSMTTGGSGYTTAPTVTFSGGGGTGASATANVAIGAVASLTVTSAGSGYTSAPTVAFSSGAATAVATLEPLLTTSLVNDANTSLLGASVMSGSYAESITGLHRKTLTVSGTFLLRRLNEIGELVIN